MSLDNKGIWNRMPSPQELQQVGYELVPVKKPVQSETRLSPVPRSILIGGNHLANQLIALGGPKIPSKDADYSDVLKEHGQLYADIWTCWAAIMRERDRNKVGIDS